MDRRSFIAGAIGAAAVAPAIAGPRQHAQATPLVTTYVTNVGDVLGTRLPGVKGGETVALVPVPRSYDNDSILVTTASRRPLGYLPTNQSRILAPMIAAGIPLQAQVVDVKTTPRPVIRLEISMVRAVA